MTSRNTYCRIWTETAIYCYNRGCVCEGCNTFLILGCHCRMKQSVFELVRKFGAPPEEKESLFTKYELKILEAIKNGCDTVADIALNLNKSEGSVTGILHVLYKKARGMGWNPRKKGIVTKSLMKQFVRWVRDEYDNM